MLSAELSQNHVTIDQRISKAAKFILNKKYPAAIDQLQKVVFEIDTKKRTAGLSDSSLLNFTPSQIQKLALVEIQACVNSIDAQIILVGSEDDDVRSELTLYEYTHSLYSKSDENPQLERILQLLAQIAFPNIRGIKESSQVSAKDYLPKLEPEPAKDSDDPASTREKERLLQPSNSSFSLIINATQTVPASTTMTTTTTMNTNTTSTARSTNTLTTPNVAYTAYSRLLSDLRQRIGDADTDVEAKTQLDNKCGCNLL